MIKLPYFIYIALQMEGMGVSAELEFLDQQNFILSLENKVLKQRLDGLSQEHLVKCRKMVIFHLKRW